MMELRKKSIRKKKKKLESTKLTCHTCCLGYKYKITL